MDHYKTRKSNKDHTKRTFEVAKLFIHTTNRQSVPGVDEPEMTLQCELSSKQAKNTCKQKHKESTLLRRYNDHPGSSENHVVFTGYGCVLSLCQSNPPEQNGYQLGRHTKGRGKHNNGNDPELCILSTN